MKVCFSLPCSFGVGNPLSQSCIPPVHDSCPRSAPSHPTSTRCLGSVCLGPLRPRGGPLSEMLEEGMGRRFETSDLQSPNATRTRNAIPKAKQVSNVQGREATHQSASILSTNGASFLLFLFLLSLGKSSSKHTRATNGENMIKHGPGP